MYIVHMHMIYKIHRKRIYIFRNSFQNRYFQWSFEDKEELWSLCNLACLLAALCNHFRTLKK